MKYLKQFFKLLDSLVNSKKVSFNDYKYSIYQLDTWCSSGRQKARRMHP